MARERVGETERERERAVLMCCVVRVGVEDDREMQSFESLGMVIFNISCITSSCKGKHSTNCR